MNYIFQFAIQQPIAFTLIVTQIVTLIGFLFIKYKVKWDGFKPSFEDRSEDKLIDAKKKIEELEEKIKFSQTPEFFKKTENGEYIAIFVAKKPYIALWTDGNWNTEEYYQQFDRFERLWEKEEEIVIHGKNPNIPSDIYHIIEKKAKELPSLTIFCNNIIAGFLTKYFSDFTNVKVIARN